MEKKRENLQQYIQRKEDYLKKTEQSLNKKEELLNTKSNRNSELKLRLAKEHEDLQSLKESIKRIDIQVLENLSKKAENTDRSSR